MSGLLGDIDLGICDECCGTGVVACRYCRGTGRGENISPLYEYEVFNTLSTLPEIIERHRLFGEYDLIAKIEANDFESIGDSFLQKIKTIKSITDTTT